MTGVLSDIRVIDLTTGIAGPYLTKLLADAGADVIKVEPPTGDPLRGWSASGTPVLRGEDAPFFRFLNSSKRSAVLDLDDEDARARVLDLAAGADVVIEAFEPGVIEAYGLGLDALQRRNPRVSLVSISNFGRGGPWTHRAANEFTLQAQAGSTDYRGVPGQEPASAGGRPGEFTVASFAAPAVLGAIRMARRNGRGEHVDVSRFEAMLQSFQTFRYIVSMFDPGRKTPRSFEIPSIEPAKDGWVGFCTITNQQWRDFCALIGAPDMAEDRGLDLADARMARRDEVWAKIRHYTLDHTIEEICELASLMRIPVGPIGDGQTVLANQHFTERGVYVANPAGFRQPRAPYLMERCTPRPLGLAPRLGEHTDAVLAEAASAPVAPVATASRGARRLPLEGIKVADFTAFWAGPVMANMLNALGADVVKVESIQRLDGMRWASGLVKPHLPYEWGSVAHAVNTGKRDVTLDLGNPEGLALAKRLVGWADLVLENFSPRVMEHFGLGWDDVRAINPKAIMCRMPAFGLDGPWRDRVGFAMTIEQVTGLAWVTGHPDGPPMVPRGICDPIGGMHAAFAVLLALEHRDRTGEAQLVEVPLVEVGLNAAAEQVVEWSANGVLLQRQGNRSRNAAPQGLYESAETDRWIALSVETDEQWRRLRAALGEPAWVQSSELDSHEGRLARHDAIDAELRAWFRTRPRDLAAEQLIAAGVPAAPVVNAVETGWNPHHDVKRFFQWM
ncbi:MAG TPA: CoA transferase, partial [Acidimicrobiales bacterium]|nr:CoA transferase [Acidimicrobiales bacterium]